MSENDIAVVILAAGLGKRMKSAKLKVMHELNGRPLIDYVVAAVENSLLAVKPVVVVASDDDSVQKFLGDRAEYVVQAERLGTGHAVSQAESFLKNRARRVLVIYGDMPFIKSDTLDRLAKEHADKNTPVTIMTTIVPDFDGWRADFANYGRVVRNKNGVILKSVEKKDASADELNIKELNIGPASFLADWFWAHLRQLKNNNAQGEYYLTDLVAMAVAEGTPVATITVDATQAIGINTPEQLILAEKMLI